jgi:hypothetical protein
MTRRLHVGTNAILIFFATCCLLLPACGTTLPGPGPSNSPPAVASATPVPPEIIEPDGAEKEIHVGRNQSFRYWYSSEQRWLNIYVEDNGELSGLPAYIQKNSKEVYYAPAPKVDVYFFTVTQETAGVKISSGALRKLVK